MTPKANRAPVMVTPKSSNVPALPEPVSTNPSMLSQSVDTDRLVAAVNESASGDDVTGMSGSALVDIVGARLASLSITVKQLKAKIAASDGSELEITESAC